MNSAAQKISIDSSSDKCADMLNETFWANDFTWQQLQVLSRYFEPFLIKSGGVLFNEGDVGGSMCILIKGCLEVRKNGKKLAVLQKARSFGEMSLFDDERRSADVIALEESEFLLINKENFERLAKEHSALALMLVLKITRLLSQHLRKTSNQLIEFMA